MKPTPVTSLGRNSKDPKIEKPRFLLKKKAGALLPAQVKKRVFVFIRNLVGITDFMLQVLLVWILLKSKLKNLETLVILKKALIIKINLSLKEILLTNARLKKAILSKLITQYYLYGIIMIYVMFIRNFLTDLLMNVSKKANYPLKKEK